MLIISQSRRGGRAVGVCGFGPGVIDAQLRYSNAATGAYGTRTHVSGTCTLEQRFYIAQTVELQRPSQELQASLNQTSATPGGALITPGAFTCFVAKVVRASGLRH